jgi:hypothetical protein
MGLGIFWFQADQSLQVVLGRMPLFLLNALVHFMGQIQLLMSGIHEVNP